MPPTPRRFLNVVALVALVASSGCGGDEVVTPPVTPVATTPTTAPAIATADALRESAEELWSARKANDFKVQYRYQDPEKLAGASFEDYLAWAEANEPFTVESFTVKETLADGNLGWVQVECRTGMRKFPDLPPRDSVRWETWRFFQDQWRPVPSDALDQYPLSPRLRDLDGERELAARFAESWIARKTRDWDALYELSDPRNRPEKPNPEQMSSDAPFEYLDQEVQWVQALEDQGVVRVLLTYRINDPSMTKLPPQQAILNDRWVRVDGVWYLDARGPAS